ncbi:MAG: alanine:cation symporter family protein, partial [Oceanococcaceae bacterium]
PFVDTLVVCTITALVILSTGAWNRSADTQWPAPPALTAEGILDRTTVAAGSLAPGQRVFVHVEKASAQGDTTPTRIHGDVTGVTAQMATIRWTPLSLNAGESVVRMGTGVYRDYPGAALTAHAFDTAVPGLGRWMVSLAILLFAVSTIITWSYYGEQGWVYLTGGRGITVYRTLWCALIVLPCLGFVKNITDIDTISTVALGFMLMVNLPLLWLMGSRGMAAWKSYFRRLDNGSLTEV